jgi:hypothetical protein
MLTVGCRNFQRQKRGRKGEVSHHIYIYIYIYKYIVALRPNASHGLLIPEVSRSHTHTQRRTTVGRTPLDE